MFNTQIAVDEFARLQKLYGFQICFETGTSTGVGSLGANEFCRTVITSEINPDSWVTAHQRFVQSGYNERISDPKLKVFTKESRALYSFLGSSPEVMRNSLPIAKTVGQTPFCFYLDAHWDPDNWPLRPELEVISDLKLSDSIIIIHDAKVPQEWEPGNGYGFDSYKGQDLCYEYVADLLAKINPNYTICYNKGGGPRGILYALP